ncbi:hypothetical protein OXX59_003971, partial [Metschnikowia pulcherrima]
MTSSASVEKSCTASSVSDSTPTHLFKIDPASSVTDYVINPDSENFLSNVETLSRRMSRKSTSSFYDGDLEVDPENFELSKLYKTFLYHAEKEGLMLRELGVSFENLSVYGKDQTYTYLPTMSDIISGPYGMIRSAREAKKLADRAILDSFDGLVKSGEMLLVLGRPGSGCSTFLRTISGTDTESYTGLEGEIVYDGIEREEMWKRFSSDLIYNPELDVHFPHLTVKQTLDFALACKTPDKRVNGKSVQDHIDYNRDLLATVFGLRHTYSTKVGNDYVRGVSGGERKRVSIAEALACEGKIYCWDNATRGLDASTALEYARAIRVSTNLLKKTALVTIYQAGENIYETFDKVTVLYSGKQVYFGPVQEAKAYFEKMGYECPPRQTTAEFLTAVTDPAGRFTFEGMENKVPKTAEEFRDYWRKSPEYSRLQGEIKDYKQQFVRGESCSCTVLEGKLWKSKATYQVTITSKVLLNFSCNGLNIRRGFYVYPGLVEDIVFGRPFLKKYARELDFVAEEFNGLPLQRHQQTKLHGVPTPTINLISSKKGTRECKSSKCEVFTLLVRSIAYSNTVEPGIVDESLFDLSEFSDVVRDDLPAGLPPRRAIEHTIEVIPGSRPKSRPPNRLTHEEKKELTLQIDELLRQEKIEPCGSPYGAPMLFVRKKDGTRRLCVDYRGLNADTVKERFPLPLIDDIFDTLAGARVFSSLDLHSGYHQVRVRDSDVFKTAFVTPYGQYAWRVMPFGLTNAPATFQHLMNDIFRPILNRTVVIYLDDILVFSKTTEEHRAHLRQVLQILREHQLVAKAKKCFFFQKELQFLGHVLSGDGIRPNPDKVQTVRAWSNVATKKQAQSFLGLTGFYRRFIKDYASYTSCIHDFIAGKVEWSSTHDSMVNALKEKLTSAPILLLPNPDNVFVLYTDASNFYMGAVLHQVDGNNKLLGVVAYESKKFDSAELNYPVREKEFYAVIHALKKWRHFLLDKHFIVYTDHESLKALKREGSPPGRLSRWLDLLEEYDMDIRHIKGEQNVVADWLSRKDVDLHVAIANTTGVPSTIPSIGPLRVNYITTTFTTNPASVEQLQVEYAADPAFATIFDVLYNEKPCPPKLKHILSKYYISDGLLYYAITTRDYPRLCIPQGATRSMVLQQAHNSLAAAHRGNNKTYELVARQYYWRNSSGDCKNYVQQCAVCQRTNFFF